MEDARQEYENPQQAYLRIDDMNKRYERYKNNIELISGEVLKFNIYRVPVAPPRVYVNSSSLAWDIIRTIALPNISYLSVLKLIDENKNIVYYFRIFIDYKPDIVGYQMPEEKEQEEIIENDDNISTRKKLLLRQELGKENIEINYLKNVHFVHLLWLMMKDF